MAAPVLAKVAIHDVFLFLAVELEVLRQVQRVLRVLNGLPCQHAAVCLANHALHQHSLCLEYASCTGACMSCSSTMPSYISACTCRGP